jgi:CPA2 family monovalent cation:H+ antiporter-2
MDRMILAVFDLDLALRSIVLMLLTVLLMSLFLKRLNQPYFVAYIIAGVLLGPWGLRAFQDHETIAVMGELGLIIQMFFIGAEIEVPQLVRSIRKPLTGVLVQLILSFVFMLLLGLYLSWSFTQIFLFSFIISLSSSAIILEYLYQHQELKTPLGLLTTGILVLQDFLIVPMLMVLNFMGGGEFKTSQLVPGVVATLVMLLFLREVALKKTITLPFPDLLGKDHELQVFTGLLICFGFAWLTSLLHLSAAMGALMAGILIANSTSTRWLEHSLVPFRIFFLALFFLSIGLQINVRFLWANAGLILTIVVIILLINSVINALVFRLLKESWRNSIYAGAMLSQIGEFSLVLCLVAREQQLVDDYWYQLTLAVVSVTMLFTAVWISVIRAFIFRQPSNLRRLSFFMAGIRDNK